MEKTGLLEGIYLFQLCKGENHLHSYPKAKEIQRWGWGGDAGKHGGEEQGAPFISVR